MVRPRAPAGSKNKRPATRYDVGRVLAMEGGMLCGRLDVPINTDPQDARAAAARMVTELARDFHETGVEVSWDPPREPWSWAAQVTLAADTEPAPPDSEG
ncbi:hypothetical protein ACFXG6_19830 [Streptomyces roseus]|uniref:hypothetical protein n=1 Tax=Streptomyces roseus TaxID=66430 RepID=UPI0036A3AB3D